MCGVHCAVIIIVLNMDVVVVLELLRSTMADSKISKIRVKLNPVNLDTLHPHISKQLQQSHTSLICTTSTCNINTTYTTFLSNSADHIPNTPGKKQATCRKDDSLRLYINH